ncbi:thiamine pyrophosphate-binding protein [Streptomyces sp. NBC_01433]|uniref:thiamine pyrophosphate-binding protein n=1 Tax=Streptomyces sp. NBC_01433 TaxID=2903864 RepID=UPI00225504B6|nr:thiamine pyrophosphate-binding protein [Streptomyces sp. NBC_01433]MCX4681812.1 thiamine pyrophosphate-binding protein [Streptomyces sp. NBC_01433]
MTTLAVAVARTLAADGVRHAFGLVGGGNILATAALTEAGVHYTAARHEGGAMAMADAYFRVTGEAAVCTTTHGPGLANAATALAEAAKNRSAAVLLCGDAPTDGPRSNDIDQSALVTSLGVPVVRLTDPATAVARTSAALELARLRQCPVVVMLPGDLLGAEVSPPSAPSANTTAVPAAAATVRPDELAPVLRALGSSRRPLLLAGAGAWRAGAGKVLRDLGDRLGALFTTTVMANGLFDESPWSLGICGGFAAPEPARLISGADLVLAFGASLDTFTLHGGRLLDPGATVVRIDLEPGPGSAGRGDLSVTGDASVVAARLLDALGTAGPPDGSGTWRSAEVRATAARRWDTVPFADASGAGRIDPRTLTRQVAGLLPADRTLVLDGGHFIAWPAMYWPVPDPAAMVFTGAAFQTIGLGLAGAVGAAVGRPDRTTVAALGDGGALMGLPELETLVRTGRSCLVVVYDDASYGFEDHMYIPRGADPATVNFGDTDFAGTARALGARAVTVRVPEDLAEVTAWRERGCPGTLLLDCKIVQTVVAPFLADLLAPADHRG